MRARRISRRRSPLVAFAAIVACVPFAACFQTTEAPYVPQYPGWPIQDAAADVDASENGGDGGDGSDGAPSDAGDADGDSADD